MYIPFTEADVKQVSLKTSFLTYLRQLSYHRRPLKGFHSSQGRSSTPRLLWSLQSPGCPYMNEQADGNTNLL